MNCTADRPVMFRAGGETRGIPAMAVRPQVILADISEFQPDIADATYLAWSRAVVIRAMYGDAHDDRAWFGGARRDALHAGGVRFLGIYQFLIPGQDPVAQARAFADLVGPLRPGELPICDLETGEGDQVSRWLVWRAEIRRRYKVQPWLYSGLDFSASKGLQPEWVAAYQRNEPVTQHLMWQFTSSYPVPGVGLADASLFHGTITDLAAHAYQPAVPAWQESAMNALPVLREGDADEPGRVFFVSRAQALTACVGRISGIAAAAGLEETGTFDAATTAAVKAVQSGRDLTPDGVIGPLTWGVLVAGSAS